MKPGDFTTDAPGCVVTITARSGHPAWAFVPDPLPPEIAMDAELASRAEDAALALGRLNGLGHMLPNPTLLIQPFIRREALASSRIEGTRADFDQLVMFDSSSADAASDPDIQEVNNYVDALESGWLRPSQRPFSTSFMIELHQQLMRGVRGQTKNPGRLRMDQVLIGGSRDDLTTARFVPPPAPDIRNLLDNLSHFIQRPSPLPALIRLALVHYQFETIHPFEDGNGRLGRLLMPLVLKEWGLLDKPLLYLSEYFERRRDSYIDHLFAVSQRGAWREWILFTLEGIQTQADDAVHRSQVLLNMRESLRVTYQSSGSGKILRIIDALFESPGITIHQAMDVTALGYSQTSTLIKGLERDGVLVALPVRRRNRIFLAPAILGAIVGREDNPLSIETPEEV